MKDCSIFTITKDGDKTCVEKAGLKEDVEDFLKTVTVAPVTATATATGGPLVETATKGAVDTATKGAVDRSLITSTGISPPTESKLNLSIEAKNLAQSALDLINSSIKIKMDNNALENDKKYASEQAIAAKTLAEEAITKAENAMEESEEENTKIALSNIDNAKSLLEKSDKSDNRIGKEIGGSRSVKKNKTCKKKGGKKHKKSQKHKKAAKKC